MKNQIEQRFLRRYRAGKRSGDRHRLFERFAVGIIAESVEHECVAHKELVLEFLHDGFSHSRPAPPMDMAQRIAATVFAQRHEFLALPDVRSQRHSAFLIFHDPGSAIGGRDSVSGQNQHCFARATANFTSARNRPSGSARAMVTPEKLSTPRASV